jgi:chromosomal replication initiation ATPase DnaA
MYLQATSARRTALTEKVFARAAEIDRAKRMAEIERREAEQRKEDEERKAAEEAKSEMIAKMRKDKLTPRDVLLAVSIYFNVKVEILKSPRKTREILLPRQVCAFIAYEHTDASFPKIGAVLHRDHTTIIHSCRCIKSKIENGDALVIGTVEALRDLLGIKPPAEDFYFGA